MSLETNISEAVICPVLKNGSFSILSDNESSCEKESEDSDSFVTAHSSFSQTSVTLTTSPANDLVVEKKEAIHSQVKRYATSRYFDNLKPCMRGVRTPTGDVPQAYILTRVERGNPFLGEDYNRVYHDVKVMFFPGPIPPTSDQYFSAHLLEVKLSRQALYDIYDASQEKSDHTSDQMVAFARQCVFLRTSKILKKPQYCNYVHVSFSNRWAMASAAKRGWPVQLSDTSREYLARHVDRFVGPSRKWSELKWAERQYAQRVRA